MKTLTLAVGFAAGYVLGSRAGRERYQEIVDKVQAFTNKPAVTQVQAKARNLVDQGSRAVADKLNTTSAEASSDAKAARSRRASTVARASAVNGTTV